MQLVLLISIAVALATTAPLEPSKPAREVLITHYDNTNDGLGNYRFAYALSDRTRHSETGSVKNPGEENQYIEVKGAYSWVGPDGILYSVTYTADENGYHPHITTSVAGVSYAGPLPPGLIASLVG